MPAAASAPKGSSRRKEKNLTPEELKDIEQKRLKGLVSCAECRRLKLRCDKKVPCGSCCRRGCESICPCGILEAGVGTRFILASTTQLHAKIALMSSRIRALEDAVAIFQASVSSERHPLLEDDLLKIKFGSEALHESEQQSSQGGSAVHGDSSSTNRADTTTLDAFGTLTLGEEGEMKYFGRSAGSETLILAGEQYADSSSDEESNHAADVGDTSERIRGSSVSSPFTLSSPPSTAHTHAIWNDEDKDGVPSEIYALAFDNAYTQSNLTVADILKHLPSRSRAEALAQSYIDQASLFFRAMKRDELFDTVLPTVYSHLLFNTPGAASDGPVNSQSPDSSESRLPDTSSTSDTLPSPHLLSTVLFIFALGSFFDLSSSLKEYLSESEMWFQLGRKALTCSRGIIEPKNPVAESTPSQRRESIDNLIHPPAAPPSSVEDTIRAVGLMATYCSMSGRKYARDSAWCAMSLAAKVAQGSGMHRDPARWHMDPTTVQRRRALWWEVCTADISHSVALGRPPSIHLSFVDCEFPTDEEATLSDTGEEVMGFWRMKYTFAMESFTPVISTTLTAKSPTYSTIMDLDRKVRELSLPPGFKPYVSLHEDGEEIYHNSHLALRDFYASQHRTVTMLYLHRSFFAHAMLTHPSNPLMSPFAPSFLAAYRAASVIIKAAIHFYDRCPAVVPRVWFLTYHVFSAAVTVGTVVKRSPNSSIAKSALADLGQAVDLFEKCASSSSRNRIACSLLRKIKDKADRAYTEYLTKSKDSGSTSSSNQTVSSYITSSSPSPHWSGSTSVDKPQAGLDTSLFAVTPPSGADDDDLAIWGGQTRLLNGLGKKAKGRDPSRSHVRRSSSMGSPDTTVATVESPTTSLPSPAPIQSASVPQHRQPSSSSSTVKANVTNTDVGPSSLSGHSLHSWNDAMDAQMDFDTNLDLSKMKSMFPMPSLSPTHLPNQSIPPDVNMSEGPLSDFNSLDFGFGFSPLEFGAGTTGSRGLLMDMAMEDIGPVGSLGTSNSNYGPIFNSTSDSAVSENQSMLMEYLSGTAEATSTPSGVLPFGLFRGKTASSSSWVPTANNNSFGFDIEQLGSTKGATASRQAGNESESAITELYGRFLNYLASKQQQQHTQSYDELSRASVVPPASFASGSTQSWPQTFSSPSAAPSDEDFNLFFESLVGNKNGGGGGGSVNSPLAMMTRGKSTDNSESSLPIWNPDTNMGSYTDADWASFMATSGYRN